MRWMLAFILLSSCFNTAQDLNTSWNTAKAEIKQQHSSTPISSKNHELTYEGTWKGQKVHIKYRFIDRKLAQTAIVFRESTQNYQHYITKFNQINRQISSRYGSPISEDDRIVINPNEAKKLNLSIGQKLASGAIGFETKWKTSHALIRHTLRGNGYEIIHVVVFSSPHKKQFADGY